MRIHEVLHLHPAKAESNISWPIWRTHLSRRSSLFVVTLALVAGLCLATVWFLASGTPVAAALPVQAQQGTYVVTFQSGVSPEGYSGATDATMNYFSSSDKLGGHPELVIRSDSWQRALLRYDLSQHIPAGAHVTSATLILRVLGQSTTSAMQLIGYPVLQAWTESQVTWDEAQSGVAWAGGGGCERCGVRRAGLGVLAAHGAGRGKVTGWELESDRRGGVVSRSPVRPRHVRGRARSVAEYHRASLSDFQQVQTLS